MKEAQQSQQSEQMEQTDSREASQADQQANLLDKVAELERALTEAQEKASQNWDLYLRAKAEAENTRRRSEKEVENAHKYGLEKFTHELLEVLDSLEHGLLAVNQNTVDETESKSILEGMLLTQKKFLQVLSKFGVEVIDPQQMPFDPTLHEALTLQPNSELAPNTVVEVVQKGYRQHARILRPARVVVSK